MVRNRTHQQRRGNGLRRRASDSGPWHLDRSQLRTLKIAIEWRRAKRDASGQTTAPDILEHWKEIEDEVIEAYRGACHEEGLYWI